MKTLQINIGLNTNKGETLDASLVLKQAWDALPCIARDHGKHAGEWNGQPEETLILLCDVFQIQDFKACLHDLALSLDQDCIAIAYDTEHGELIGPRPNASGFTPEFFQFLEWPLVEIDGWNQPQFITYLHETLIPDLKDSGSDATAEDFETAVKFISLNL